MKNLKTAIDYFGSQKKLAEALGVQPMAITKWKDRQKIPTDRAIQITEITKGKIKLSDLIPDKFK